MLSPGRWASLASHFGTGGSGPPTGRGSGPAAQQAGLGPPLLERLPLRPTGCHDLGPLHFSHGASYLETSFLTHLRPYPMSASHTLGKTLSLHRFPQEISCCAPHCLPSSLPSSLVPPVTSAWGSSQTNHGVQPTCEALPSAFRSLWGCVLSP